MKRRIVALLVSGAVFMLVWTVKERAVSGITFAHESVTARYPLEKMQEMVVKRKNDCCSEEEVRLINEVIKEGWGRDMEFIHDLEADDRLSSRDKDLLARLVFQAGSIGWTWERPPVFTMNEASPDGFGFYLEGDDGISESNGSDPDDLNSWSGSSYYYRQWRRGQMIEKAIWSTLLALPIFFVIARRPCKKAQDEACGEIPD